MASPAPLSSTVIRATCIDDLVAIGRLSKSAFDPCYGEAWSAADLTYAISWPNAIYRVGVDPSGGRVIGFTLSRVTLDEAELLLIAVAPEARRSGLAGQLMTDLIDQLPPAVCSLLLEVRVTNSAARALYNRFGFVEVGRRPDYYAGTDGVRHAALTMKKSIVSQADDFGGSSIK